MGGPRGRIRRALLALTAVLLAVPVALTESVFGPDGEVEAIADNALTIELRADEFVYVGTRRGVLRQGGDVDWRNRSGRTLTVTSPDGLLDSGPIPDGGSFHASLPVGGTYTWESEVGGDVIIVEVSFEGENDARALDHIPDLAPPPRDPDDIGLHPDLVVDLSRTIAIVGFTETATVLEARQALGSSWQIVGGFPEFGLVYAKLTTSSQPPTNFAGIDASLDSLNNNTAVEFAAYDFVQEEAALPPPSSDVVETRSYWESPQTHPVGAGDNWGLELARVPQAWNLNDAMRIRGAEDLRSTVAVDTGFEPHVDLDRLQTPQFCTPGWLGLFDGKCTTTVPSSHGNQIAGIIGADFDGVGVTGIDSFSRLYGIPWKFGADAADRDSVTAMKLMLQAIRDGDLGDVATVNISFSMGLPKPVAWWARWGDETCGPGPDDDLGATGICYPDTHDETLKSWVNYGRASRRIIEGFVEELANPPLFVVATANDSLFYCPQKAVNPTTGLCELGTGHAVSKHTEFQWAEANWRDSVGDNPIVMVESIGELTEVGPPRVGGPSLERSEFSNIDGQLAASGMTTAPTASGGDCSTPNQSGGQNGYCFGVGTSLAAPVVAGIAGLLASWDPSLTAYEIKQQLVLWSTPDTTDGAAPRVDAFAALMSLPGAAKALVDVSDPSLDGNRRVVYGTDGTETVDVVVASGPGLSTSPDGVIDLRDFRRFRDAWLLRCQISPEAGCPAVADVALDGADDHPKRDLNLDGCVRLQPPASPQDCPSELTFPRFDFNGDGLISRNARATVPIASEVAPAAQDDHLELTDLELMERHWSEGTPGTAGVMASELDDLLISGDLTLVADELAPTGATTALVTLVDDATDDPIRSYLLPIGGDPQVLTVPAGHAYRIDVEADGPASTCSQTIGPFRLLAGEDRSVDLSTSLSVLVQPNDLRFDEVGDVLVAGATCNGDVAGTSVDLALDPAFVGGAELADSVVTLDGAGRAVTTVAAGALRSRYEITANADIPVGPTDVRSLTTSSSFTAGDAYDLELAAVDDDPSGYFALDEFLELGDPVGPSVNGAGDVAFGALVDNDDRYRIYVSEPGDNPAAPAEADSLGGTIIPPDTRVTGEPELNDAGQVAFTTVRSDGTDITTGIYLADPVGFTDELATGLATLGGTTEPYSDVERPTINGDGRVIFVVTEQAGDQRLAERQAGLVVVGPETFGARPQLADDGTSVVQATVGRDCAAFPGVCGPLETIILDPIILVGPDVQPSRAAIAEGRVDGWGALSDPDISPPGDVIAFVGDRNDTAGLFISVRRPNGTWQEPIAIEGPAAAGDLVDVVRDRPTVAQIENGSAGPVGDRILVTVRGSESGATGPAAEGVFVVPVDLAATGDPVNPIVPNVDRPRLVAQVGDVVDSKTINRIELSDSLAAATTPAFDGDHWAAFYAEAVDGSNMHVRARALAPPEAAAAVPSGPGAGLRIIRRAPERSVVLPAIGPLVQEAAPARIAPPQVDPSDVVVVPGPHIAAVTVDDDTPNARQPVRIVNRSRAFDGSPAWGIADESTSNPDVLLNPELMTPDGELFITYPRTGNETLSVGAPLSSGEFANSVSFRVTVQDGENRPPVGDVSGPYVIPPGGDVQLRATGLDPDGGLLSYRWDLDDDGVFDDGNASVVNLTAADVQAIICGGSCVLEQPYPIAVRVLDDRGLDAFAASTLTVSGLTDILLRLDPALIQANPGSSARSYAFVDKPAADPAVPVEMSIEGEPAGWNVSITDDIDSGEAALISARVPDGELEGSFSFDVVARAGDVERRATLTVVTLFGLIPECSATIEGRVTDESGAPIAGALVAAGNYGAGTTGADGTFEFSTILPRGATIANFNWTVASPSDPLYVDRGGGPNYIRCDETTVINPVLREVPDAAGLTMRAVAGLENPVQPTRPIPTDTPVDGVKFTIRYTPERFSIEQERTTSPDGTVLFADVPTQRTTGSGLGYSISAFKEGFWGVSRSVTLTELDEGLLVDAGDFPLIPACSGTVTGGRVVDQFGDPVEDASVRITSPNLDPVLLTGADGTFTFDETVFLGTFNRPRNVSIRADSPSDWEISDTDVESTELGSCGASTVPVELELERIAPEVDYFGTLVGTVTDDGTGDPLEGVNVAATSGSSSRGTRTDADGNWQLEVFTGTDPAAVRDYRVVFAKVATHWQSTDTASVPADTEVRVDGQLVAKQLVALTGTVTDAETGEPVEGAEVSTGGIPGGGAAIDRTDENGAYELTGLELEGPDSFSSPPPNSPRATFVQATFDYVGGPNPEPYWRVSAETTLVLDEANVLDLEMIPVCADASVSGLVVNAATLEPLEDVEIFAGGKRTFTNADGRYDITGIRPGRDNAPLNTTVFARKPGFFDASIDITTFCGAELIVDFGTPFGGFGSVTGTVTDSDTGDPLADVFIGSTWGDSTTTAGDGTYTFDRAPLTSDGEPRDWTISANRNFDQLQQVVTVSAEAPAVVDFQFGTENLPPTAFGQSVATDTETALPITLTGNDPEGESLTFEIVDDPTLGTLSGTTPALTYTPSGTAGDDSLTFTVSDGERTSEPATITIEVTAVVNEPPVISAPATVEVTAGQSREIGVSADDPDDDPLEFSLPGDAGGRASLDDGGAGTAVITVDTDIADAGQSVEVEVAVTDGELGDEATITVDIVAGQQPVNRSPDVVIDAPDRIDEGTTVVFDASGSSDPDGDALTFAWTLVDFDGATVATGIGPTWSYEFDDDFLGAARLLVTDARGETAEGEAEILVLNVVPDVRADVKEATSSPLTASIEVEPGATVDIAGSFTDPGADTHQLVVDWGDGIAESIEHRSGAFVASHVYPVAGTFTAVVEVCDDDEGCGAAGDEVIVGDGVSSPPIGGAPTTTTTTVAAPVAMLPPTGWGGRAASLLALASVALGFGLLVMARRRTAARLEPRKRSTRSGASSEPSSRQGSRTNKPQRLRVGG